MTAAPVSERVAARRAFLAVAVPFVPDVAALHAGEDGDRAATSEGDPA